MGYTKLFSEICLSTAWALPDTVRIVWITMLAIKDENHEVMASVPGLAGISHVTRDKCEEALKILERPDPDSRSQDHQGRRIAEIRGGWKILNGEYYRKKMSKEERKEYQKQWVRDKRANLSTNVDNVAKFDNVYTTEQNKSENNITKHKKKNTLSGNPEVLDVFSAYCKSWGRNDKTYLLTPDRIKMIKMAISLYGRDGALKGVENFRNDPFEKRSDFCDIKYLFGKQDRIDKFCQPQAKSSKIINVAQKKHQEGVDRIAIVNQMLDQRVQK